MTNDIKYHKGSGNVFEDLGFNDPVEMQAKARLALKISQLLKEEKITQVKASKLTGIAQGDLSKIVNGNFAGFTIDRMFSILLKLGQDIDINIHPAKNAPSNINFAMA